METVQFVNPRNGFAQQAIVSGAGMETSAHQLTNALAALRGFQWETVALGGLVMPEWNFASTAAEDIRYEMFGGDDDLDEEDDDDDFDDDDFDEDDDEDDDDDFDDDDFDEDDFDEDDFDEDDFEEDDDDDDFDDDDFEEDDDDNFDNDDF